VLDGGEGGKVGKGGDKRGREERREDGDEKGIFAR